jgi:hypothetical protein
VKFLLFRLWVFRRRQSPPEPTPAAASATATAAATESEPYTSELRTEEAR